MESLVRFLRSSTPIEALSELYASTIVGPRSEPLLHSENQVAKDPTFDRDGADIYVDSNISFTQAILGGKVEVPTLSGKTQVKIPKGVQHGYLTVLRGRGLPRKGLFVDHGDQYVRFRINFPTWRHILDRIADPKFMFELSIFMGIIILFSRVLG